MAFDTVAEWDTTPALNTEIAGYPISDASLPNTLDNWQQNSMAQIRTLFTDSDGYLKVEFGGTGSGALSDLTFATVANMVASEDVAIGQYVRTVGYLTSDDGGGNIYLIVEAATGVVDGGEFIDLTGITGQAKGMFPTSVTNVRQWGATGDGATYDTVPIDNYFVYLESNTPVDGTTENGARGILLLTGVPVLNFPPGEYLYGGAGYIPIVQRIIAIRGHSPASTTIRIDSDVHFIHPTDASSVMNYIEISDIKIIGGRGAFFNEQTTLSNVQLRKIAINCVFAGYTSVAFGSIQDSDARWTIRRNFFEGGDIGTPVGLLIPDEVAELDVGGDNTFTGNKYDIICANSGISELVIGPSNTFFNLAGHPKEADIWLQPGGYRQGVGVRLFGNRHSNENIDTTDPNVLIADRAVTASHIFTHSTTVTIVNRFDGLTMDMNSFTSGDAPSPSSTAVGFVLSYASRVSGFRFTDNLIGQWRPYVMEYASGLSASDVDTGMSVTNFVRLTTGRKGINAYDVIGISNIPGAGMGQYDNRFNGGMPGIADTYSDGTVGLTTFQNTSVVRGWGASGGVTETDILDAAGGATAATFEFAADTDIIVPGHDATKYIPGQVFWIEADVKKSAAKPLDAFNLEYKIGASLVSYQVVLTDDWQRIRIPLIAAAVQTNATLSFQMGPRLFIDPGVKDSFDIGRFSLYMSQGPVEYAISAV